jgi:hypothetical protein
VNCDLLERLHRSISVAKSLGLFKTWQPALHFPMSTDVTEGLPLPQLTLLNIVARILGMETICDE